MFFRIRAFSRVLFIYSSVVEVGWWVWPCISPFSGSAEISAFSLASLIRHLNLPESRMCVPFRVTHVRWTLLFQKLSLCVLSQILGSILTMHSPVLAITMF